MGWEAWSTLGIIGAMAVILVRNWAGPDTVMVAGITVLMTLGLFSDAFPDAHKLISGFGSEAPVTIGVLFVVAAGLTRTGAMNLLAQPLLGRPGSVRAAQFRLLPPVAVMSAFLNNTPIVAMFIPVVHDWCRKQGLSRSKLFMPLSYAAILGGSCSLIGTSTNLIVYGMLPAEQQDRIGMFTIAWVGLPVAVFGFVYILVASKFLLKDKRTEAEADLLSGEGRRYSIEMLVDADGPLPGKTIEQAGLRALPGSYLAEVERDGERLVGVAPNRTIKGGDRLIFVGRGNGIGDLQKIRGLVPATDQVFKLSEPRPNRRLVEAVVSKQSALVSKTIKQANFRTAYNGVVIAVHRDGKHLDERIGDIVLHPGDTLLIEAHPSFVSSQRHRDDFYLVSALSDESATLRDDKAVLALVILAGIVAAASIPLMPLLNAALLGAGLMVVTGCLNSREARRSIQWRLLLAVGGAIGVGFALESTGAAEGVGRFIVQVAEVSGPHGLLAGVYLTTMIFNMMVGHAGAAALALPIALNVAEQGDLNVIPFAIAVMIAAAAEFAIPISYPTHLMVYGAGGYRVIDYVRFGLPLNFLVMAVVVGVAPLAYSF